MTVTLTPPTAPAAGDRIQALDVLRGFALLGMIVVHFHQRVHTGASGFEGLIGWIVWIGIEGKSWGTFAFLFGVGFAVLLRRLEARGVRFGAFYLRRLFVLALFGIVAEAAFGFQVLLEYAIWGVPLVLLYRLPTSWLLLLAAIAAMANPVITAGAALHWWPPVASGMGADDAQIWGAVQAASREASFGSLLAARLDLMRVKYFGLPALVPGATFVLFLLGLLALRHGLVDDPRRHVRPLACWMAFGFVSWAIHWAVLYQVPDERLAPIAWQARYGFGLLNQQWLCFTFIGTVLLLFAFRAEWRPRLDWVGTAGRMALTNYMLQVAVLDYLASGYGLSLRLRPVFGLIGAGALFGVEVVFSRWWLARYRFGPCEWVWRSLTYGRAQPMRRMVVAEAGGA
jgi:uncharacterized protein